MTPADHVIDLFKVKLRDRMEKVSTLMMLGVDDFPHYRELVGEFRAYSAALADAKEALKAATEDPDDE